MKQKNELNGFYSHLKGEKEEKKGKCLWEGWTIYMIGVSYCFLRETPLKKRGNEIFSFGFLQKINAMAHKSLQHVFSER